MGKLFKKAVESPAIAIEKTIEISEKITQSAITETIVITESMKLDRPIQQAKSYWKMLGPGLTTGAADDDPSGIATYSQAGAQYGFQLLWLAAFTFPLMATVQEMCARIGIVTGRGLAANIKTYYPRWVLYFCTFLLFTANSLNIGADLGAMAKAIQLLAPSIPFALLVIGFTALCIGLQIFTTYEKYARFLKYLALVLLAYVFTAFMVKGVDWGHVLQFAITPSFSFSKDQILLICGILGTTISPYLFFWQTSQEVEDQILEGKTTVAMRKANTTEGDIRKMRIDIWSGMFLSNVVMFFIIVTCAATIFGHGSIITTAADAAAALRPLAGDGAYLLFALGIIGTGLLAIPVLAGSASYALSESLGWKQGLYRKLNQAHGFYGVIIISMLVGLAINFTGIDPIKALIYSAIANGIVAPVVLLLIVGISSNHKAMGKHVNKPLTQGIGEVIIAGMAIVGIAAIIALFN